MQKQLKEDTIEATMSTQFEAKMSKKWFKKQLNIKKTELRTEESDVIMKRMIKAQRIMKDIEIDSSSFQITITDNTSV